MSFRHLSDTSSRCFLIVIFLKISSPNLFQGKQFLDKTKLPKNELIQIV